MTEVPLLDGPVRSGPVRIRGALELERTTVGVRPRRPAALGAPREFDQPLL
ncbi:hypothetical protein [Actinoallomurus bryophytorum]|uniref:hypothetical protein n=1 Tax=Actinoallomurus bryophytorum TaxID=1490222 RepID=UPI00163A9B68|nr:hypothetical protein [Actinoallomurus bryophytorum]